ncbi:nucleotidyltransferase domain-containing protein [candidate division KSB1 bacterium]|nr:nucleotidyltransferase domain-containing protein [candidate division KSB1 bacterium]
MKNAVLNRRRHHRLHAITQTSRSRKRLQSVPRSFYWWPITSAKIRQAAQKIVDAVDPEKIILFGSFAYGKPNFDSDVDLLVIMESDKSAHARSAQISEILCPRPFPVDIIVRTPTEVTERLAIGDYFFQEILTKGKVLYERASRR